MATTRVRAWLVAGWVLTWSSAAPAWSAPTVSQMLGYKPKMNGVVYSTPTVQDQENCKVERVSGQRHGGGWLLRDPQGRPLRRFFDSRYDGVAKTSIDIWSYYLDGVEVYREIDTNFNGVVDQYRWMNTGGMKWGIDTRETGKIDYWKMISPEEVSQEILQAIVTNDFDRLHALWITDAEIKALELPDSEAARLRELQAQAQAKFTSTVSKLALTPQARWERLEANSPQCIPADQTGMKRDLIKYLRSTILFENNGKHDWLQTGELIQVGAAWRLVDAPAPGMPTETTSAGGDPLVSSDPAVQPLLEELRRLDGDAPKAGEATPTANQAVVRYHMQRAALLQKIAAKVSKVDDREQWIRQVADSLSAAAQSSPAGDKTAYDMLLDLEQRTVKSQPNSALAAYVTFREMSADYAVKLAKVGPDFAKVQEQWLARLAKFVQDYASAEDTPDALLQLGMVSEFLGKEIEAKKWYQQLATGFADKKPLSEKAAGALRRLDLEGKPLEFTTQAGDGKAFDIASLRGKIVIVYYWASYTQQSVGDFARFKVLLGNYAAKGVELVSVNLDNGPPEAGAASDRAAIPGIQLAHPAGLDSPLAVRYGIMALPTMFLVGKDGKVVSRSVQMANLEEEIKKLVK
jgi:hypothetical protein